VSVTLFTHCDLCARTNEETQCCFVCVYVCAPNVGAVKLKILLPVFVCSVCVRVCVCVCVCVCVFV